MYANREEKRLRRVYQQEWKIAEYFFLDLGQDFSRVLKILWKYHFGNLESNHNRQQKFEKSSSAYGSGLGAFSLASDEAIDSICIEYNSQQYFQKYLSTMRYWWSSNGRSDLLMISAGSRASKIVRNFSKLKCSVQFAKIPFFVLISKDYEKGMFCRSHNRRVCLVRAYDPSSELCFVSWYDILKRKTLFVFRSWFSFRLCSCQANRRLQTGVDAEPKSKFDQYFFESIRCVVHVVDKNARR